MSEVPYQEKTSYPKPRLDNSSAPIVETARRLSLAWGLHCVLTEDAHDLDDVVERAARIAESEGFARPGERIVVTAGVPLGTPGATNLLRVAFIDGR